LPNNTGVDLISVAIALIYFDAKLLKIFGVKKLKYFISMSSTTNNTIGPAFIIVWVTRGGLFLWQLY